jgi:uncharacterized protein YcnI
MRITKKIIVLGVALLMVCVIVFTASSHATLNGIHAGSDVTGCVW